MRKLFSVLFVTVWFGSGIAAFLAQWVMFNGTNYDLPSGNKVFVPSLGEHGVYVSRVPGIVFNVSSVVFLACSLAAVFLSVVQRKKS